MDQYSYQHVQVPLYINATLAVLITVGTSKPYKVQENQDRSSPSQFSRGLDESLHWPS